MKRRALLLGALLMPTATHARTTKQKTQAPAPKRPAPPPPVGPQPLKEAKTQLVAFNASPFPYRSVDPATRKPFLDVKAGNKRGHTSLRGDVYWEDPTYSDRRSLLYLPAVVLVGAVAYLVALPAFFSVLMPLQPQSVGAGRPAAA